MINCTPGSRLLVHPSIILLRDHRHSPWSPATTPGPRWEPATLVSRLPTCRVCPRWGLVPLPQSTVQSLGCQCQVQWRASWRHQTPGPTLLSTSLVQPTPRLWPLATQVTRPAIHHTLELSLVKVTPLDTAQRLLLVTINQDKVSTGRWWSALLRTMFTTRDPPLLLVTCHG